MAIPATLRNLGQEQAKGTAVDRTLHHLEHPDRKHLFVAKGGDKEFNMIGRFPKRAVVLRGHLHVAAKRTFHNTHDVLQFGNSAGRSQHIFLAHRDRSQLSVKKKWNAMRSKP